MDVADKFNDLITVHVDSLDPTPTFSMHVVDDDEATVVTSNCSPENAAHASYTPCCTTAPNLMTTARSLLGNPSKEQLNALTIASTHAIADTGATSIFIMKNAAVVNKKVAT